MLIYVKIGRNGKDSIFLNFKATATGHTRIEKIQNHQKCLHEPPNYCNIQHWTIRTVFGLVRSYILSQYPNTSMCEGSAAGRLGLIYRFLPWEIHNWIAEGRYTPFQPTKNIMPHPLFLVFHYPFFTRFLPLVFHKSDGQILLSPTHVRIAEIDGIDRNIVFHSVYCSDACLWWPNSDLPTRFHFFRGWNLVFTCWFLFFLGVRSRFQKLGPGGA